MNPVTRIEKLVNNAKDLTGEISFNSIVKTPQAEVGIIRFKRRKRLDTKMIMHNDHDVVCYVTKGEGTVLTGGRRHSIGPGSVCHIPAKTRHDFFTDRSDEMVLVYALLRTDVRKSDWCTRRETQNSKSL